MVKQVPCKICGKLIDKRCNICYCESCRPAHIKRQLKYYHSRGKRRPEYQCPDCGKPVSGKGRRCIVCAKFALRPESQKWLGRNRRLAYGRGGSYIHIKVNGKWIPEHRYIWEQSHGQKLPANYQVHHLDGDKLNNDQRNLYALCRADHHSHKFVKILQDHIKGLQRELRELTPPNHLV